MSQFRITTEVSRKRSVRNKSSLARFTQQSAAHRKCDTDNGNHANVAQLQPLNKFVKRKIKNILPASSGVHCLLPNAKTAI